MNGKIGFFKELLKKIAERGNSFDDVVEILKEHFKSLSIEPIGPIEISCSQNTGIVRKVEEGFSGKDCYGIYIIRCKRSENNKCTVIYIGKSGTYSRKERKYHDQAVRERLTVATRYISYIPSECGNSVNLITCINNISPKEWFCLLKECCCNGCKGEKLELEVICLDKANDKSNRKANDKSNRQKPSYLIPAFVEALLIQYYYLENDDIPIFNRVF